MKGEEKKKERNGGEFSKQKLEKEAGEEVGRDRTMKKKKERFKKKRGGKRKRID